MKRRFLCIVSFLLALDAGAIQQVESFATAPNPGRPIVDVVGNRLLTLHFSNERTSTSAVSIIDAAGGLTTKSLDFTPVQWMRVSQGRILVNMGGFTFKPKIAVLDDRTFEVLQSFDLPKGGTVAYAEATGKAYAAYGIDPPGFPWEHPGGMSGKLVEIDLATGATHSVDVPKMYPSSVAVSPDGRRVYMSGVNYFQTGQPKPGFMSVYDVASRSLVHSAVPMGLEGGALEVHPSGRELYLQTSLTVARTGPCCPFGIGAVPAILVLDPADLSVKRTLRLPDYARQVPGHIGDYHSRVMSSAFDVAAGRYYGIVQAGQLAAHDTRLIGVDLERGVQWSTPVEGYGNTLGFNPVTRQVLVSMPGEGHVAVFEADNGARVDSVPFSRPATAADRVSSGITYDPRNGDAYVTSGHENLLLRLPASSNRGAEVVNLTDLWWNPSESGWGVYLEQQAASVFAVLFTHAADGSPTWLVMSAGRRQADGSFVGQLFSTSGPREMALSNMRAVGTMRLSPAGDGRLTLTYDVNGQQTTKAIERQVFSAARSCGWTIAGHYDAMERTNFTSLWYNPAESGWGLALSQRGDTAFAVLFSYDARNHPTWSAMSNGAKQGLASFGGELFQSKSLQPKSVGDMAIDMASQKQGTLSYSIDGVQVSKPITRQYFAPLASACSR